MPKRDEEGGTPIGTANPQPVQTGETVTASIKGKAVTVPAAGFVDNLKGLDFGRVIAIIEEGAGAAIARDWFSVVRLAGELASVLGELGRPEPMKMGSADEVEAAPRFAVLNAAALAPHFDRFDRAATQFDQAKGNTFAIPPQRFGGSGQPGSAPPVAFDPTTILVALEFFGKLVDVIRAWRNRNK